MPTYSTVTLPSGSTSFPTASSASEMRPTRIPQRNRGNKFILLLLSCGIVALTCVPHGSAEYFSSVDKLLQLYDAESGLVDVFSLYLEHQQKEFSNFRKFIENIKVQHSIANNDTEDYLGNPINAFTLIKRMVIDWNHLHEFVKDNDLGTDLRDALKELVEENGHLPDVEDVRGAALGFARLQRVYKFNTIDLVNGDFGDSNYGNELSWEDCFDIGTSLFEQEKYNEAVNWLNVTLNLLDVENVNETRIQKFQIDTLEYLALASFELGFDNEAISYIDEILEIEPDHNAKHTKAYMRSSVKRRSAPLVDVNMKYWWFRNYTRLCRGIQEPEKIHHSLKCTVERRNNPTFILVPMKREELSLDPEVTIYHDLLNDKQIEKILELADNNMFRSRIIHPSGTGGAESEVRVSQQAWLNYSSPVMKTIYRMVTDVTGLNVTNAELMQMANYGIGGQYDPHCDFYKPNFNYSRYSFLGDRLCTNMFYLSDVDQGGYTVFPKANLYLRPIKGSMVSWYNVHKSLDGDHRTMHAGCPVIKGSKRIGNVWVHTGFQEFRRPCGLESDTYKSLSYHDEC